MKFLNNISFDVLKNSKSEIAKQQAPNATDESQVDAYGVGAAMPADIIGFAFASDNRNNVHLV